MVPMTSNANPFRPNYRPRLASATSGRWLAARKRTSDCEIKQRAITRLFAAPNRPDRRDGAGHETSSDDQQG